MIVNFFSVKATNKSHNINILFNDFGANIPRYLPLEGGSGLNYLFCVAGDSNILAELVHNNGYQLNGLYGTTDNHIAFTQLVVDDDMYNREYQAGIQYFSEGGYFLCK